MAARAPVLDYLVYLVVRTFICVVQAMPWELAFATGRMLAWLAYHLDPRHRQVAIDNLRVAFPELSEKQLDKLVRRTYRHFGLMVMEIITLQRKMNLANHQKYFLYPRPDDY